MATDCDFNYSSLFVMKQHIQPGRMHCRIVKYNQTSNQLNQVQVYHYHVLMLYSEFCDKQFPDRVKTTVHTMPPEAMAMSRSVFLRLSPNPGAFTAQT